MTITTKFNIGDKVLALLDGKLKEGDIYSIAVDISTKEVKPRYMIEVPDEIYYNGSRTKFIFLYENLLFRSKEELIASL